GLIEVDRRDGEAGPPRHLTHRQFIGRPAGPFRILTHSPLTSTFVEVLHRSDPAVKATSHAGERKDMQARQGSPEPAQDGQRVRFPQKATLLLASALTIMAGATIAPALPAIETVFAAEPDAALLTRLVLTAPALAIAICAPFAGGLADRIGRRPVLLA